MEIIIIAATGKKRELGLGGKIPWHLPEDLQNFKKVTMGRHIIMGRKTYESLGRPLPGRVNLVVSSTMADTSGVKVFKTLEEALRFAESNGETEAFICGGAKIYEEALSKASFMYLTQVDYEGKADTFFPEFESGDWEPVMKTTEHESVSGNKWCLCVLKKKHPAAAAPLGS